MGNAQVNTRAICLVWVCAVYAFACNGNPSSSSTQVRAPAATAGTTATDVTKPPATPTEQSSKQVCKTDVDCVGQWRPSLTGCGSIQRCVAGVCQDPPAVTGNENPFTARLAFETGGGDRSFSVELASDRFATTRGLMCRREMKNNWGMLFEMERTRVQSFWMKNTLLPLDIIFIDENWTVVGVSADATPGSLSARTVGRPSRYVFEINSGLSAELGIQRGTPVRYFPPARP